LGTGLRTVTGPASDFLPHIRINLIKIFLDRKDFAARRAAEGDHFSADAEFNLFTANLALHRETSQPACSQSTGRLREQAAHRA